LDSGKRLKLPKLELEAMVGYGMAGETSLQLLKIR
jgi:hypothetical protein